MGVITWVLRSSEGILQCRKAVSEQAGQKTHGPIELRNALRTMQRKTQQKQRSVLPRRSKTGGTGLVRPASCKKVCSCQSPEYVRCDLEFRVVVARGRLVVFEDGRSQFVAESCSVLSRKHFYTHGVLGVGRPSTVL